MKTAALVLALFGACSGVASAQNPSMSDDYQSMMQWLTKGVSDGLAFNAGSTFDPPTELRPWHIQPDVSMGVGWVPLDKSKFPALSVPALTQLNPASFLPNQVTFPNLTLHMRMGLPDRWDVSVRGADMTVPKGYRLTPTTTGEGQSNSLGFTLRRHFFGGDLPLLSLSGNYNHVFGRFYFSNTFRNLELVPGFFADSYNHGILQWDVNSLGFNAVTSQTFGILTPFAGLGYNHMSGSVRGRLESDFSTPFILPVIGEASQHPEEHQARFIFGAQMDRSHFSFFINGEMKMLGVQAGKTFYISSGIVAPFRIGASSVAKRRISKPAAAEALAYEPRPEKDLRDAPKARRARNMQELRETQGMQEARNAQDAWNAQAEQESRDARAEQDAWDASNARGEPYYNNIHWNVGIDTDKPSEGAPHEREMPEMIFIH